MNNIVRQPSLLSRETYWINREPIVECKGCNHIRYGNKDMIDYIGFNLEYNRPISNEKKKQYLFKTLEMHFFWEKMKVTLIVSIVIPKREMCVLKTLPKRTVKQGL